MKGNSKLTERQAGRWIGIHCILQKLMQKVNNNPEKSYNKCKSKKKMINKKLFSAGDADIISKH